MTTLMVPWLCAWLCAIPLAQQPPEPAEPAADNALESAGAADETSYEALRARLVAGDRTIDFAQLRLAFTGTPAYRGTMMSAYQALWRPLQAGDFAQAVATAEQVLAINYVEINAHMVASIAYQQLGQPARADFHRFVANALLRVVLATGDGESPETAYHVIDISEEYAIARSRNLSVRSVASSHARDQLPIDSMTVVDPRTGTERVIHFNFARARDAYDRAAPR